MNNVSNGLEELQSSDKNSYKLISKLSKMNNVSNGLEELQSSDNESLIEDDYEMLETMKLHATIISTFSIIITLLGNTLLIFFLFYNKYKRKRRKFRSHHTLIIHMCISNLCYAVFSILPTLLFTIHLYEFDLPLYICKLYKPLERLKHNFYTTAKFFALFAWVFAFICSIPNLIIWEQTTLGSCEVPIYNAWISKLNILFFSTVAWILPCILVAVLFYFVYRVAYRKKSTGPVDFQCNSVIIRKKYFNIEFLTNSEKPLERLKHNFYTTAKFFALFAWVFAFICSIPNLIIWEQTTLGSCEVPIYNAWISKLNILFFSTVAWILPCILVAVLFYFVYRVAYRKKSTGPIDFQCNSVIIREKYRCTFFNGLNNLFKGTSILNFLQTQKKESYVMSYVFKGSKKIKNDDIVKKKKETLKLTITIVIVSFLMYSPFAIVNLMDFFNFKFGDGKLLTYILFLGNLNTCSSPIIYLYTHAKKVKNAQNSSTSRLL
uniref:G_PROTEIN_RECEP_F1_2 domain-containing protein n=1 Tax=Strongyloides papillosus TaxID=174720 RepID=A0A0N5C0E8_STREA